MSKYIIGFANLSEEQLFSVTVREGLEAAAQKRSEIELVVRDNALDSERALANVQEFVSIPVDLAFIYHVDERFNSNLYSVLRQHQVPAIAVDIPMPLTVYFGVNNKQAGTLAGAEMGKWIQAHWGGRVDKVLAVTDSRLLEIVRQRLYFALEGLAAYINYSSDDVLFLDGANMRETSRERALPVLEHWSRYDHIAILGLNDDSALGALDAAYDLGLAEHVVGVGQGANLLDEAFSQPEGRFIGSVAYFPNHYGEKLVDLSLRLLRGEKVPRENFIEHVCITRDNFHLLGG